MCLSNKITFSMARRMKGRASCPPGIGVHGALAEGFERGLRPSRVTRDARVLKGLKAGRRYPVRKLTSFLTLVVAVMGMLVALASIFSPSADAAAPHWTLRTDVEPSRLSPTKGGWIVLLASDDAATATDGTPVRLTDTLPEGLAFEEAEASILPSGEPLPCTFAGRVITCDYRGEEVAPGHFAPLPLAANGVEALTVKARIVPTGVLPPVLSPANVADISGGGAAPITVERDIEASEAETPFGLDAPFAAQALDSEGREGTTAGAHPNLYTTELVQTIGVGPPELDGLGDTAEFEHRTGPTGGGFANATVVLPPGLVGDPLAAPTCAEALLEPGRAGEECPSDSVIGEVAVLKLGVWGLSAPQHALEGSAPVKPLYNVTPSRGHAAQFAFIFNGQVATLYADVVHTPGGYTVEVTSTRTPRFVGLRGVTVTFFGDPVKHDGGGTSSHALISMPANCAGGPLRTVSYIDSWDNQGASLPDGVPDLSDPAWIPSEAIAPPVTGCNKLFFNPEISLHPTSSATDAPSGLHVDLRVPQNEEPEGLATPPLKNVTVELPRGLSISPSSANGLQACSDAQFAEDTTEPSTCPEASVVGSVKVNLPILKEELEGQVFVGAPQCNPCTNADAQSGRMVRLFIEVKNAERGIDVKLPGTVSIDPSTGQLTATFKESPQQPFDNLEFKFKSGERAPLSTPSACGSYATNVDLTPWSTPYTPDANLSPGFNINEGCGPQGFAPAFSAGPQSSQAGAYSPLVLSFSRKDGEQDFNALEATLPPGQLAKLAGVPRCGESEANAGTCPESSKIGTVTVGAGPGSDPYYVTGQIYFTGPYNGGPFGEVVEVPAVAGPFNLGTVAVRGSIRVNPTTAQATVVSDPFPSILDGIPLQVRTVNATLNRESFTFNPTSCAPMNVAARLTSTQGAAANVSSPVQAVNCANLAFKPAVTVSTQGRASKANGASLTVKIVPVAGQANTAKFDIELPKQFPARLTTLQKACTEAQFNSNPAGCPSAADIGTATVSTPVLSVPVAGPIYLVSHGGAAFPDVEVILQGEGVRVVLDGKTQIKHGVTYNHFEAVPDVPFTSFEAKLPTGKFSIFGANLPAGAKYSFCGQKLSIPVSMTGQNGAADKQTTKVGVTGCPKTKKAKAARKKHSKASKSTRRGN